MTIVSLRGTHGSGKSTVARTILETYGGLPTSTEKRPSGYDVPLPGGEILRIVGPYTTACGGCDAVQPFARVWPLVDAAAKDGHHVLFEGALISTTYGSIGTASETYGDDMIFAYLDTPLDTCIERVRSRRALRGDHRPFDPRNVEAKFHTVRRNEEIARSLGRRTVTIDHRSPVRGVLALLGVKLKKEPTR